MSESGRNGGPGRPPGVKNGEGKSLEPIKNWTIKHDTVVSLHCSMHSNEEIAEMVDFTSQRVSQILNDPQGKRMIREHQERLRERLFGNMEDELVDLCVDAVRNLKDTVSLEGLSVGSDFKKHQDKVSLELLKGNGLLSKDRDIDRRRQAEIPKLLAERIATALEKTAKVADELEKQEKDKEIEVESTRNGNFTLVES